MPRADQLASNPATTRLLGYWVAGAVGGAASSPFAGGGGAGGGLGAWSCGGAGGA